MNPSTNHSLIWTSKNILFIHILSLRFLSYQSQIHMTTSFISRPICVSGDPNRLIIRNSDGLAIRQLELIVTSPSSRSRHAAGPYSAPLSSSSLLSVCCQGLLVFSPRRLPKKLSRRVFQLERRKGRWFTADWNFTTTGLGSHRRVEHIPFRRAPSGHAQPDAKATLVSGEAAKGRSYTAH